MKKNDWIATNECYRVLLFAVQSDFLEHVEILGDQQQVHHILVTVRIG